MNLNVSLIYRCETPARVVSTIVKIQPESTVGSVKQELLAKNNIEHPLCMKIIFGGKKLDDDAKIESLCVGGCTVIHAIILLKSDSPGKVVENRTINPYPEDSPTNLSSFFVFCKSETCNCLRTGKLRVRCNECQCGAIELEYEPSQWEDVTHSGRIPVQCVQNACPEAKAQFYFKCAACSDRTEDVVRVNLETVPLTQIHSNRTGSVCATCGDVSSPVMDMQCYPDNPLLNHVLCIGCFVSYSTLCLQDKKFQMINNYGYSLTCPVANCTGFVKEPHHFRLLGKETYDQYQKLAAERCILEDSIFCPTPDCGAAYIWNDDDPETTKMFCPACGNNFCRLCKFGSSQCICDRNSEAGSILEPNSAVRQSLDFIELTCKPCPRCRCSTERNGGCSHMHCRECSFDWCWLCHKEWTQECQWDHWFL